MTEDNAVQHHVGDVVNGNDIDPTVPRVAGKRFEVVKGNSCTGCSFTGLGHRTCKTVRCSRYDRDDGVAVNYKELGQ